MKKYLVIAIAFFAAGSLASSAWGRRIQQEGYILEYEKDLAAEQPGPHSGGGNTTAYNFFTKAPGFKLAFRKRLLHAGSSIGYHLQKEDEIYYIISGSGEMKMNGESFTVNAGDAILTRPGSSHGIKPAAQEDLSLMIAYEIK